MSTKCAGGTREVDRENLLVEIETGEIEKRLEDVHRGELLQEYLEDALPR